MPGVLRSANWVGLWDFTENEVGGSVLNSNIQLEKVSSIWKHQDLTPCWQQWQLFWTFEDVVNVVSSE